MICFGIDPGTGVSSPTGLAIYDNDSNLILWFGIATSKAKSIEQRIQQVTKEIKLAVDISTGFGGDVLFCIEDFVMRGKGGENLKMLTGAIISTLPEGSVVMRPYNVTVKKHIAGHGHAEKPQVAEGLLTIFKDNPTSFLTIKELINNEQWDILDALAIAVTGCQQYETRMEHGPAKKSARRKRKASKNPKK